MTTSLLIDLVILALLAGALVYGVILTRRISKLQKALVDLAPALQAFCDAVEQSERSVEEMRAETDRMSREANRRVMPSPRYAPEPAARQASKGNDRSDLVRRFFETARTRAN